MMIGLRKIRKFLIQAEYFLNLHAQLLVMHLQPEWTSLKNFLPNNHHLVLCTSFQLELVTPWMIRLSTKKSRIVVTAETAAHLLAM
jgi:hypothetical protein